MTSRQNLILFLLLLIGLTLNLLTVVGWTPAHISNDGIQYISTAKNWLTGNGFSTDALIYAPHFQGVLPALQTVWPPGYPIAIGITSHLGFHLETTVLLLNLIMHVAASVVMWLILLRMGTERFFAAVCAFFFYLLAMPWVFVSFGLTEPLFTTLLLLGMLSLPVPNKSTLFYWIPCGLFLAASILVRYSSVFAAFGTGAGVFIYLILHERRSIKAVIRPCINLTILLALPTSVFGYLMYMTYTITGTLDRFSGTKTPETLISTTRRWLAKFSELLGFSANDSVYGWMAIGWFLLFSLVVAAIVLSYLLTDRNYLKPSSTTNKKHYLRLFTLVAFFHSLSLIIYLTINSIRSDPLEIITRYIYQIYPNIYAIFCFMLFALYKQHNTGKKQTLLKAAISVLVVLYTFAQINSVRVSRPIFFRGAFETVEMLDLPVDDSINIKSFIKRCFASGELGNSIWSPHAQAIHLHTGIPTISKSHNYTEKPFDADAFQDRITQYQTGMFIFFSFLNTPNENHDNYLESAKDWLVDNHFYKVDLQKNTFGVNRTISIYSADPKCGFD